MMIIINDVIYTSGLGHSLFIDLHVLPIKKIHEIFHYCKVLLIHTKIALL